MDSIRHDGSDDQSLEHTIRSLWDQLPAAQRQVAAYLLKYPVRAAFSNLDSLAQEIGISTASIIRLSQQLGYDGFLALKNDLKTTAQSILTPSDKVEKTIKEIQDLDEILHAVVRNEINYLEHALHSISTHEFRRAVRYLNSAERIGVIGFGVNETLVNLLSFRLRRFRLDVVPITQAGKNDNEPSDLDRNEPQFKKRLVRTGFTVEEASYRGCGRTL